MKESMPMALIVDDDIDWVEILDASIGTLGYDTTAVPDPPQARAWLSQNRPALILVDLLMPNGNGVEAAVTPAGSGSPATLAGFPVAGSSRHVRPASSGLPSDTTTRPGTPFTCFRTRSCRIVRWGSGPEIET